MKISYVMHQEKQTKNKVVYKNLDGAVDTVYVDKNIMRNHMEGDSTNFPQTITLTIES